MDKVDSLDPAFFSRRSDEKKTRKKAPVGRRQFADAVREAQRDEAAWDEPDRSSRERRSLAELLDEVHSSGDQLLEAQNLEAIKRYRTAVRGFLDRVLARMLRLQQLSSGTGVARRKRFTQVQVVDRKLERLLAELLAGQSRQLDILARVNEIGGLLVDLLT